MTVTVKASHLARILNDVLPFASRDVLLPMINGVCLEAADGVMSATATDRYCLVHARTDATGHLGRIVVRLADAIMLARLFKTNRRAGDPGITVASDGSIARFAHDDTEEIGAVPSIGIGIRLPAVEFPDYVKIFGGATREKKPVGVDRAIGLNLALMAKFAKVSGDGMPARVFTYGPNKTLAVEIGSGFTGMIMPVRLGDDTQLQRRPETLAPVVPIGHSEPEQDQPAQEAA